MDHGRKKQKSEQQEAWIFQDACARYDSMINEVYGPPIRKGPDTTGACVLADLWIARVRELLAYSDTSAQAREFLLESEGMRESLIASLCDEVGGDWHLFDLICSRTIHPGPCVLELDLDEGDRIRLGRLRVALQLSRPFVDEGLQKLTIRTAMN